MMGVAGMEGPVVPGSLELEGVLVFQGSSAGSTTFPA